MPKKIEEIKNALLDEGHDEDSAWSIARNNYCKNIDPESKHCKQSSFKVSKLASIFYKKAQVLELGQSTLSKEKAIEIGILAKNAFEQIQEEIIQHYNHDTFEKVINELSVGKIPPKSEINKAVSEFENGIKNFENMFKIPFNKLLHLLY